MSSDDYSDDAAYDDDDVLMEDDGDSAISEEEIDMEDLKASAILNAERAKHKYSEVDYESLSQAHVESLMSKEVEHISGIFGVDESTSSLLLRHMNWNKERLIEKYMDKPDVLNVAAGVCLAPPVISNVSAAPVRSHNSSSTSKAKSGLRRSTRRSPTEVPSKSKALNTLPTPESSAEPEIFVCPICYDDTQSSTLSLQCGHQFCTSCWTTYLTSKIREEGEHSIRCMATDCTLVTPDAFIASALNNDDGTYSRFRELLDRHFVASNPNLKFCPYPNCTYTVSCPAAAGKLALNTFVPIVDCGAVASHKFCFGCSMEGDHRPIICTVARYWLKKCRDDSETANWIKTNTKECGKCQSTIEKNGGCNHMTCKKCKYEFCWVCMGPWSEHGTAWYSCNRYEETSGIEARDAQSRSRASLERYLHYYNRWANHEQSARLSLDLYAKTEKKMEEMQMTSNLTWIEVQFAKKAVDEVEKCRMTLKWTYAMAYFLEKSNEKDLFEDNQRDLERAVEDLSELLESPIEAENISILRQKITDKTVYVQKRNEIMLEDTAKGYLEGRWKWNVPVEGFD